MDFRIDLMPPPAVAAAAPKPPQPSSQPLRPPTTTPSQPPGTRRTKPLQKQEEARLNVSSRSDSFFRRRDFGGHAYRPSRARRWRATRVCALDVVRLLR